MQTFCCSSYYVQLSGPFFNYHDTNETQERLHLCQNTLGKPFTTPNFLMHCVLYLLILAVSVRYKKSSCDFVKVWKEETPSEPS